jgi:hypothetical protein
MFLLPAKRRRGIEKQGALKFTAWLNSGKETSLEGGKVRPGYRRFNLLKIIDIIKS